MVPSVIITTYKRNDLLDICLPTVMRQGIGIVYVVNDAEPDVSSDIAARHGAEYIQMPPKQGWRNPGRVINYVVKRICSEYFVISCAEIYHLDNTLELMLNGADRKRLVIPSHGFDDSGRVLNAIHTGSYDVCKERPLKTELPFCMMINRDEFISIGGYDEDLTGHSYDDDDIVERLIANGCKHHKVDASIIHLYHSRKYETINVTGQIITTL